RDAFVEVGGFEEAFTLALNDVDFCLKLLARGYRNVCMVDAELYHHESLTRGYEDTPEKLARFRNESRMLLERWTDFVRVGDPYFSRNLDLGRANVWPRS